MIPLAVELPCPRCFEGDLDIDVIGIRHPAFFEELDETDIEYRLVKPCSCGLSELTALSHDDHMLVRDRIFEIVKAHLDVEAEREFDAWAERGEDD